MKYWHTLMKDKECQLSFFLEAPIVSYKRDRNIDIIGVWSTQWKIHDWRAKGGVDILPEGVNNWFFFGQQRVRKFFVNFVFVA